MRKQLQKDKSTTTITTNQAISPPLLQRRNSSKRFRDDSRALYKLNEHVDDSHVPNDFFSNMSINRNLTHFSLWTILNSTLPMIHQSLMVISFLAIEYNALIATDSSARSKQQQFMYYHYGNIPSSLFIVAIFSLLFNFSRFIILSLLVYNLSPVIQTLTATFSNDTICTTSIIFFAIHLLTFDYEYFVFVGMNNESSKKQDQQQEETVPQQSDTDTATVLQDDNNCNNNSSSNSSSYNKPLNGALSLSCLFIPLILLGSRCTTPLHFFHLFLNMHFFFLGILPFRKFLYHKSFQHVWLALIQWISVGSFLVCSVCTWYEISTPLSPLLIKYLGTGMVLVVYTKVICVTVLAIVFGGVLFWYMHVYHKRLISGPWDEAKLNMEEFRTVTTDS